MLRLSCSTTERVDETQNSSMLIFLHSDGLTKHKPVIDLLMLVTIIVISISTYNTNN